MEMERTLKPKVGIAYLTYHQPDSAVDIPRCFESIRKMTYPMDRVIVYCVENTSVHGVSLPLIQRDWDPIADGIQFPMIRHRTNSDNLGYSGGNNVAVEMAKEDGCDFLFLLNQDTDVDPNFLTASVERMQTDEKIGLVQSLLLLGQERELVNSIGNQYHFLGFGYSGGFRWTRQQVDEWLPHERKNNSELIVPYVTGAAVLVRMTMVREIGLFDTPFFMYHEDVDATFNARLHGWKSVVEPASIVYHYYAFSKSIKKFYWMERNRYIVNLTYLKVPTLLLLAPAFFCVELISFLLSTRSGWWKEKWNAWMFLLHPSHWKWIWIRRQRAQRERQIGDREFLQWATSKILFQNQGNSTQQTGTDISNDVNSGMVTRIANPLLTLYWRIVYACIRW